jgi:hypothetical protein
MFSPAVDWSEYEQDHDSFTRILKTPHANRPLDRSLPEDPMPIASSDELSMTEQFLMNTGVRPRPQEGSIPTEFDEIRHLIEGVKIPLSSLDAHLDTDYEDTISLPESINDRLYFPEDDQSPLLSELDQITGALNFLMNRLSEDHPDIVNLRQAQKQLVWKQIEEIKQSPIFVEHYDNPDDNWQSNLGTGNPYEMDEAIEPQMPNYEEPALQEILPPEPMLEEMVDQGYEQLQFETSGSEIANAEAPGQFMSLDVFDTNPAFDEINQAMDQATVFEQPEMDPWKKQYDPFNEMGQMFDQQMQYMADPFMMPGPMGPGFGPMMGPM